MYLRGLGVLEAQETLRAVQASAYPYLKTGTRKKFYSDVKRLVVIEDDSDPVRMEDLAAHLEGLLHG